MSTREMTILLPNEIAERLMREVPAADLSRFVSELVERSLGRLSMSEEFWARACAVANEDAGTAMIEAEMGALRV